MAGTNLSVTKALDVLDLLGQAHQGLRLKDIAAQLELPESTAHRLLASLTARGYVQQHADHGLYMLGWKIVVLADSLGREARLVQNMRPLLDRLVRQLGQTVNLAVRSNNQVMYLDCQTPSGLLALTVPPGLTLPMHATSLGKTLLAHLPENELESALNGLTFEPITPTTITSKEAFRDALADVRLRGYAVDHGELRADVSCLAAPVLDGAGRAIAAISMTARSVDLPANWEQDFPPLVTAVAREASETYFGADLAAAR
jgi:IclR family acetate operon transcriptional repressor